MRTAVLLWLQGWHVHTFLCILLLLAYILVALCTDISNASILDENNYHTYRHNHTFRATLYQSHVNLLFCCCWQQRVLILNQYVAPSEACAKLEVLAMHKQLALHSHLAVDTILVLPVSTPVHTFSSLMPISITVSVLISIYSNYILLHVPLEIMLTSYGMMHTLIHSKILKGIVLYMHCITLSYLYFAVTHMNELRCNNQSQL